MPRAVAGKTYTVDNTVKSFSLEEGGQARIIWAQSLYPFMPDGSDAQPDPKTGEYPNEAEGGIVVYYAHDVSPFTKGKNDGKNFFATLACVAEEMGTDFKPFGEENCLGCYLSKTGKTKTTAKFGATVLVKDAKTDEWTETVWYFSEAVKKALETAFAIKYAGHLGLATVGVPLFVTRSKKGGFGTYSVEVLDKPSGSKHPMYTDPIHYRPTVVPAANVVKTPQEAVKQAINFGIEIPESFRKFGPTSEPAKSEPSTADIAFGFTEPAAEPALDLSGGFDF